MMKAKAKIITTGVITLIMAICFYAPDSASAAEASILYPGTETPSSGNVFIGVSGTYENYSESAALKRINEIRKEAYNEGIVDSYVPIKWSKSLEFIAQIRSVEASVKEDHVRPVGGYVFNMSDNGVSSWAENLAWGAQALGAIELWYSEKEDLVNNTGKETGHYESLVSPDYEYIGLGSFKPDNKWVCVCAEFTYGSGLDEGRTGISGKYVQMIEAPESDVLITVSGSSTLKEGGSATFKAYGKYGSYSKLTLSNISWTSSNSKVAKVSKTGTVTATAAGSAKITAKNGNLTASKSIKVDHNWNTSYTVDSPATCTKAGSESIHCAKCGAIKEGSAREIAKKGHSFGAWKTIRAATCTQAGSKERVCSVCKVKETKTINALGHSWKTIKIENGLFRDGKQYDQCKTCGLIKNERIIPGYANYYVKSFKVKKGKKCFTAKWKKQSKANQKKFDGYQIIYSTKSNMSDPKYATAKKSSKSKKISKLAKNTKYYIKVRTYTVHEGVTYYSKWSAVKSVKTK